MKAKKMIAFVTCLAMVFSLMPCVAFADDTKAKTELVYMEYVNPDQGDNYKAPSAGAKVQEGSIPEDVPSSVLVGIRLTNMSKLPAEKVANKLYSYTTALLYDGEYLELADDINGVTDTETFETTSFSDWIGKSRIGNSRPKPDGSTGREQTLFSKGYNLESSITNTKLNPDNASDTWYRINLPFTFTRTGQTPTYDFTSDEFLAVIKFTVKKEPENGGEVFKFNLTGEDTTIAFGTDGSNGSYAIGDPSGNLSDYMEFDTSGMNIFPKKAAPIGGTASIDGTLTYGETLTVDTSSVTGTTNFKYQWNDGTNDIAGATGKTFTVNQPALVGKTLKCIVKPADTTEASGSVTATAGAAIAKKQLTVSGTIITAKTFDNKTNATATGTTLTGKVGSDVVNVTATAAFADKNAGTNKNVTVNYTLSGAAAGAYQLDKTTETLQGTINKAQLTVGTENKSVKVGGSVALTGKVTGEVAGASAGVTYTYAVKDGSTDVITVSGANATGVAPGSKAVTVTGTIGDTTNYEFATGKNTAEATVTVADKVPASVAIKTQPTKLTYDAGETLDLTGLAVTVTYDDNSTEDVALADFAAKNITADPANGTTLTVADHNGKPVTISINGKKATTNNLTVATAATKVTVKTKGAATKKFDGTNAVAEENWTAKPVFESNNGAVDTSKAVYTFAQTGVGTCDINVTGLTVNGEAASVSGSVADGTIETADTVLAFVAGTLNQTAGSTKVPTVTATPADGQVIKVEIKETTPAVDAVACDHTPGTAPCTAAEGGECDHTDGCAYREAQPAGENWVTLDAAKARTLKEGTYAVRATSEATANTSAVTTPVEATLKVSKKSSGGGGGGGTVVTDYTVKFSAGDHGKLEGKLSVTVAKDGKVKSADIPKVTPEEGYVFAGWTLDGKTTVDPTAAKVTANVNYTALYKASKGTHGTFMSGYTDGTFRPDGQTTRAEVASLMAGLIEGYDKNATYTTSLNDIDSAEWYAQAVKFMSAQGLITGYEDGTFRPNRQITRQEFCAIIAKYLDLENKGTTDFNDVADAWGQGYIAQLATKGIVSGYPDGSFMPNKAITRAEVTTILNKVFDRVPDQKLVNENIGNYTVRLSDVTKDHWAYYQILEAAMEHEVADFH